MYSIKKIFTGCSSLSRNKSLLKWMKSESIGNEEKICSFRAFSTTFLLHGQPMLSPQEVTEILSANEYCKEFNDTENCIKSYESNQLPSNSPIEDTRSEGKCLLTSGTLIGVFDGHSGPACAQVVAKRLFEYICVNLLPKNLLEEYLKSLTGEGSPIKLIERYNEKYEIIPELKEIYRKSFVKHVQNILSTREENFCIKTALKNAILSLDNDISNEALNTETTDTNLQTISVAMSGAVACVAHIDGSHLHIANVGDSKAVLGVLSEDNYWLAKELTRDHNAENFQEVQRIRDEHPDSEKNTVIRDDRLLGQLAPLRAFGDVRYKWNIESLMKIVVPYFGNEIIARGYNTPPYLTAEPEIIHHTLTSRDKFLMIASDGLWEMLSPLQVVRLVGEHMRGKVVLNPFKVPKKNMKLRDISNLLSQRQACFSVRPSDRNAVTHLFRNALGSTNTGLEHSKLCFYLTKPKEVSRYFRDDMTVTIVYFNPKFWRQVHY